ELLSEAKVDDGRFMIRFSRRNSDSIITIPYLEEVKIAAEPFIKIISDNDKIVIGLDRAKILSNSNQLSTCKIFNARNNTLETTVNIVLEKEDDENQQFWYKIDNTTGLVLLGEYLIVSNEIISENSVIFIPEEIKIWFELESKKFKDYEGILIRNIKDLDYLYVNIILPSNLNLGDFYLLFKINERSYEEKISTLVKTEAFSEYKRDPNIDSTISNFRRYIARFNELIFNRSFEGSIPIDSLFGEIQFILRYRFLKYVDLAKSSIILKPDVQIDTTLEKCLFYWGSPLFDQKTELFFTNPIPLGVAVKINLSYNHNMVARYVPHQIQEKTEYKVNRDEIERSIILNSLIPGIYNVAQNFEYGYGSGHSNENPTQIVFFILEFFSTFDGSLRALLKFPPLFDYTIDNNIWKQVTSGTFQRNFPINKLGNDFLISIPILKKESNTIESVIKIKTNNYFGDNNVTESPFKKIAFDKSSIINLIDKIVSSNQKTIFVSPSNILFSEFLNLLIDNCKKNNHEDFFIALIPYPAPFSNVPRDLEELNKYNISRPYFLKQDHDMPYFWEFDIECKECGTFYEIKRINDKIFLQCPSCRNILKNVFFTLEEIKANKKKIKFYAISVKSLIWLKKSRKMSNYLNIDEKALKCPKCLKTFKIEDFDDNKIRDIYRLLQKIRNDLEYDDNINELNVSIEDVNMELKHAQTQLDSLIKKYYSDEVTSDNKIIKIKQKILNSGKETKTKRFILSTHNIISIVKQIFTKIKENLRAVFKKRTTRKKIDVESNPIVERDEQSRPMINNEINNAFEDIIGKIEYQNYIIKELEKDKERYLEEKGYLLKKRYKLFYNSFISIFKERNERLIPDRIRRELDQLINILKKYNLLDEYLRVNEDAMALYNEEEGYNLFNYCLKCGRWLDEVKVQFDLVLIENLSYHPISYKEEREINLMLDEIYPDGEIIKDRVFFLENKNN
ncbi:MAG: hypothetical protein ACTSVV_03820, partial [Promethearchaeota archaeon]